MSKTYIGLHPNNLNRTEYGKIVLYVEGVPVATFEDDGNVTITGDLAINGITNVSASIADASNFSTGSLIRTASISDDTITFTKGDGSTFNLTVNNVESASYASSVDTTSAEFLSGTRAAFSFNDTSGSNGVNLNLNSSTGEVTATLNEYTIQLGDTAFSLGDVVSSIAGLTMTGADITGTFTGSLSGTATNAISATSASHSERADFAIDASTATTAATASSADSFEVRGDLTVDGIVTAREFHTTFVSASIVYQSGSTKFGDSGDDIHSFTGSVNITGSLTVDEITGNITTAISASFASSALTASYALSTDPTDTGSLLNNATVSNATLTFTKGDGTTFDRIVNNVANASSATSASFASSATSASHAIVAVTASYALSTDQIDTGSLLSNATVSNATLTFTKGDGTTFDRTIDNVANATNAVTASYALNVDPIDTGSLLTNATVSDATLTFTKGDGTTFDRTINNVANAVSAATASYVPSTPSASHAERADLALEALAAPTGSLLNNATVSDATLTFTKGDGTTFDRTINNVVNAATASYALSVDQIDTGSFVTNATVSDDTLTFTQGDGTTFDRTINNVANAALATTASYALSTDQIDTGSFVTNATVLDDTLTFTQGDGTTFDRVINNVASADSATSASHAERADFALEAATALNAPTGSLLVNATVSNDTLTFTKGDGSTFDRTINNVVTAATASYVASAITASHALNAISASHADRATLAITAETASSADNFLVREDATVKGDLTVEGIVTAKEFHTTFVSASILYSSGSTKFGDTVDDIHSFTGSVEVDGEVDADDVTIDDWGSISASLASINIAAGGVPTLQQVTGQGSTTTETVTVNGLVISTIYNANTDTDKFLVLDSSGNVVFRTGGEVVSDIGALQDLQSVTGEGATTTNTVTVGGVQISTLYNANTDTDKFLVADSSGNIVFRTGTEMASDIGALQDLQSVTGEGSTTTNTITVGGAQISTLYNANTDTDKFLVADSSGNVVFRTGTEVASDIGALTSTPNLQAVSDIGATTTNSLTAAGLNLTSVSNAGQDTDKFLVLDSLGNVDYRTGAEVLSDIGAGGATLNLQDVTDNGSTTTNAITTAGLNLSTINNAGEDTDKFLVIDSTGNVEFRTGAEVLSDIGASTAVTLQDVTDNGNTSTNDIIVAGVSGSSLDITGTGTIGGVLTLETVNNANEDTDKFLVVDSSGNVEFRTGDEMVGDLDIATSSFDGNRGVTNPLLPDLVNYNPGTDNVVDFLEQVFYPDAAAGIDILSNEPFYIVESELSESIIYTSTNGYSGAQARQTVTWILTITDT
jgi:hypothetical protein